MAALFEPHEVQRPGVPIERVHRPATVAEALELRRRLRDARVVAGGTDLIVELERSSGPPIELIDVSAAAGFRDIEFDPSNACFRLGGAVTHNDVVAERRIVEAAHPLAQACREIGSPQLRNRATVAGNLVTASPANDTISALMALGAAVELARMGDGVVETRRVPVADFFTGFRATVVAPDELVTAVEVPALATNQRGVWAKLGLRKAQAISVVHVGLWVEFEHDASTVAAARIALGSVAPMVVLSDAAAQALVGNPLEPATIRSAAMAARDSVQPIDDGRASAAYRSAAVATMVERALQAIADGTEAETWPDRVPTLGRCRPESVTASTIDPDTTVSALVDGHKVQGSAGSSTALDWLRSYAGTGTKEGCAEGECGACTVIVDGGAAMSCLMPAAQLDGSTLTTVHGLAIPDGLSPIQQSFVDEFAVQCGYCIPGFVVAATALAADLDGPKATRAEIEAGLAGNLCRCTGYYPIITAVQVAIAGTDP